MGIEQFFSGLEHSISPDLPEGNIQNIESERPQNIETPGFEVSEGSFGELPEAETEDSEREITELPHLETDNGGLETDDGELEAGDEGLDTGDNAVANETESNETTDCNDVQDIYYSTYDERLRQTPGDSGERGEWSGERGESDFTPNDEEIKDILAAYGLDSIAYKDAIPDFSEVSEATVEIDNMTEKRSKNFEECDKKCAEQWNKEGRDGRNDWTARDVKEWRQNNGYTWHERNDMKTCDLIPTKINDYFGHLGGVSECKKRDAEYSGGEFDE